MKRIVTISLILLSLLVIVGCASLKRTVLPEHRLMVNMQSSAYLNPNEKGQASPVAVYFYQLKSEDTFENAEFFDLYDKGKETLGDSYIAVNKVNITPHTTAQLTLKLKPGVEYIGVVAAYRNIQGVTWRTIVPVNSSWGRKKIRLVFNSRGVFEQSMLKTGTDLESIDFDRLNMNSSNKQSGRDMRYRVIKRGE